MFYCNLFITRCADTGIVPPANGVIVKAGVADVGLSIPIKVFITVVCINETPTICDVPVALPTTLLATNKLGSVDIYIANCPGSVTET